MSTGRYTIWAYWQNREENASACAVRLARMFENLAAANSAFSHWYKQAMTLAESYKPFCAMPPQIKDLAAIIQQGQHKKDVPPEPWPELGFSVSAWNGIEGERGLRFGVRAGAYGDRRVFPNNVTIDVHSHSPENADLINSSTMNRALAAVIDSWEVSWGCVCSALYTKRLYAGKSFAPGATAPPPFRSGWMSYLSAPYAARIVPPKEAAIVETMPHGGLLMRATDEVFSMENPAHLAAADAIQAALEPLQFDPRTYAKNKP